MSGILNAACCCTSQACERKRPFEVTYRLRAAAQRHMKFTGNRVDPPSVPPCPPATLVCECPDYECTSTLNFPSQPCSIINEEQNLVSLFDTTDVIINVPYVSTNLETQGTEPSCGWKVDLGAGPVQSGMTFTGQREVDRNHAVVRYDLTYSTCARCVAVDVNPEGEYAFVHHVDYRWRCLYLTPPAYFLIRREASGTFLNWQWEIVGGVFNVKNATGVVTGSVDLSTRTLSQARAAIDALAGIICTANFGAIPADAMPATLIEDRGPTLIPLINSPVPLFAPLSREVEVFQHGNYGPSWTIYTRAGSNPSSGPIPISIRFPFKADCDASSGDYTGGVSKGAELNFCKAIAAKEETWQSVYSPLTDPQFTSFGTFGAGVLTQSWLGTWSCDSETGMYTWTPPDCTTPPVAPDGWGFVPGPFGVRATAPGTALDMCSDASTVYPTYCLTFTDQDTDFCDCGSGIDNYCLRYEEVLGWRVYKYFEVARL